MMNEIAGPPRGQEIYNFGIPFICHHYLICLIHAPCIEEEVEEEILQFYNVTMPKHKNPCPVGHGIYNFGRPFFGYHYFMLSFSYLCQGEEKKIFKQIMHFHYMPYMATS